MLLAGTFMPWVGSSGDSVNGLDYYYCADSYCSASEESWDSYYGSRYATKPEISIEQPGIFTIAGAVFLALGGVILLTAGRIVPVAVIWLIVAALGSLFGIGLLSVAVKVADQSSDLSVGAGAIFMGLSTLPALAGGIVALAQRGRPAPAPGY